MLVYNEFPIFRKRTEKSLLMLNFFIVFYFYYFLALFGYLFLGNEIPRILFVVIFVVLCVFTSLPLYRIYKSRKEYKRKIYLLEHWNRVVAEIESISRFGKKYRYWKWYWEYVLSYKITVKYKNRIYETDEILSTKLKTKGKSEKDYSYIFEKWEPVYLFIDKNDPNNYRVDYDSLISIYKEKKRIKDVTVLSYLWGDNWVSWYHLWGKSNDLYLEYRTQKDVLFSLYKFIMWVSLIFLWIFVYCILYLWYKSGYPLTWKMFCLSSDITWIFTYCNLWIWLFWLLVSIFFYYMYSKRERIIHEWNMVKGEIVEVANQYKSLTAYTPKCKFKVSYWLDIYESASYPLWVLLYLKIWDKVPVYIFGNDYYVDIIGIRDSIQQENLEIGEEDCINYEDYPEDLDIDTPME